MPKRMELTAEPACKCKLDWIHAIEMRQIAGTHTVLEARPK